MEGGTAAESLRIPINVLLKFPHCQSLAVISLRQRKMMANDSPSLAQRGRGVQTEYPRISQCPSADHHSVTARLFQHLPGQKGRGDISVSNDRDADGLLHRRDQTPICPAAIPLSLCSGMDGDGIDATLLRDL